MRERDEMKRSKLWKVVMTASTAIILLLMVVFSMDVINSNPLEGEWVSMEKGYYVEFDDDNEMTVEGVFGGQEMEYDLVYELDKSQKLIKIKGSEDAYGYVTSAMTTEENDVMASGMGVTFSYSLENNTLTLIDRDYGSEFVFTKK